MGGNPRAGTYDGGYVWTPVGKATPIVQAAQVTPKEVTWAEGAGAPGGARRAECEGACESVCGGAGNRAVRDGEVATSILAPSRAMRTA